jgi:DNA-binding NtrC family response regulator
MASDDAPLVAPGDSPGLVLAFTPPSSEAPRVIALDRQTTIVGREPPRGAVAIPQTAVSRVHASIKRLATGELLLSDLGSRNGTFKNGVAVKESVLAAGDVVRIGDTLFVMVPREASAHLDYDLRGAPARKEVPAHFEGLVGGASMGRLERVIQSFARSDATVLITGETGVGKEVTARALHLASGRPGAFKAINCAAIPAALVESELFGHERGAFSGAVRAHEGMVRSADQGTLLLDEIGDMSLDAQAKLLRVLETREVLPVGATRPVRVDVRVVCATHRALPAALRAGSFRPDLYARIAQREVAVPTLRSRKEDLFALAVHHLGQRGRREEPSASFVQRLLLHDWPFNVRELVSALSYAVDMAGEGELRASHLPPSVGAQATEAEGSLGAAAAGSPAAEGGVGPLPSVAEQAPRERRPGPSRAELASLLAREHGNMLAVARALDRDPAQVYRWVHKHALDPDDFR